MKINYEKIFHRSCDYIITHKIKTLLIVGVILLGIALLLSPTAVGTIILNSDLYLLLLVICFGIPICYHTIAKILTVLGIKKLIRKKYMNVCIFGLIVVLSGCRNTSPEYEIHKETQYQNQQEIKANQHKLPLEPYILPSNIRYRNRSVPGNVRILE